MNDKPKPKPIYRRICRRCGRTFITENRTHVVCAECWRKR